VVADSNQNRLFLIPDAGGPAARLPLPGSAPLQWTALALAPGLSFYALDGPGHRVHQYDVQGNYQGLAVDLDAVVAAEGLGSIDPAGLAVDRSGHAVLTDQQGDRLLTFGPGWNYLGVWGQSGIDLGSWRRPGAVAVGSRGSYLVADVGNHRVVLLDSIGNALADREMGDAPRGVAVLDGGRFAVGIGNTVSFLGAGLLPLSGRVLPPGPGCRDRAYATTALAADGDKVFVGEGCSGRIFEMSVRGN
jgi:DNA-binding beta-propeller fold protein YncE